MNSKFGKWKTASYGRKKDERTNMEKVSEMRGGVYRRIIALYGLQRKTHKDKTAKGEKISPGTKVTDRLREQLHRKKK
jgi:hypothetical protein